MSPNFDYDPDAKGGIRRSGSRGENYPRETEKYQGNEVVATFEIWSDFVIVQIDGIGPRYGEIVMSRTRCETLELAKQMALEAYPEFDSLKLESKPE